MFTVTKCSSCDSHPEDGGKKMKYRPGHNIAATMADEEQLLYSRYSAPNTITTANQKVRMARHVACTGRRNVNTFVQGKTEGKRN